MSKQVHSACCALLLTTLGAASVANATLVSRLDGMAYYDDEADLTWLADANYAKTSGYDADGLMNWETANLWAESLDIEGITGWRLPTTLQPDPTCNRNDGVSFYNLNCKGSEMGNMFYNVLGGRYSTPISSIHNDNYNLFENLLDDEYWSSTEFEPQPISAWYFGFNLGVQNAYNKETGIQAAWAVHSGDVALLSNTTPPTTGSVPEPASIALMGLGLAGFAYTRGRGRTRKTRKVAM